jgi:mRNA-degrading endonuclease RelE of RelBE toxin-antitoxin system
MNKFVFTNFAERKFKKLESVVKERVLNKLLQLKVHADIFFVLKHLNGFGENCFRLRIGNIRLILFLKSETKVEKVFLVADIGYRKNIYK